MKIIEWDELIPWKSEKNVFFLMDDFFKNHPFFHSISEDQRLFIPAHHAKTLTTAEKVWKILLEKEITKHDLIVGVGGGSITDLTTFVAGTYKRGVPHALLPTTLLAATDAAIGGKGGIDFGNLKNSIGVTKLPDYFLVVPSLFQTLNTEEQCFGWAEVVKHALIGSHELKEEINQNQFQNISYLIEKSIEFKISVVEKDVFENKERKILNFGHTLGHALESYQLDIQAPLSHGKSVVWGMLKEIEIMEKLGKLGSKDKRELTQWIGQLFPTKELPEISWEKIFPYLKNDKKNEGNLIGFVEFCGVGRVNPEMKITLETVQMLLK